MSTFLKTTAVLFLAIACRGDVAAERECEADIQEAVLRHLFQTRLVPAHFYFIRVGNGDPTAEFMKRFSNDHPPVRPDSEAEVGRVMVELGEGRGQEPRLGVVDRRSGKQGVSFSVGNVRWLGVDKAEVTGSIFVAPLGGMGFLFRVGKRGATWVVLSERMIWVS